MIAQFDLSYSNILKEFDLDSFNSIRNQDFMDERTGLVPAVTPNSQNHPSISLTTKIVVPSHSNQPGPKREIQLPKTRVSSRGQLYLSTGDRNKQSAQKLRKGPVTSRSIDGKSYAKKWIEDISNNVTIEPADLLDDNVLNITLDLNYFISKWKHIVTKLFIYVEKSCMTSWV